MGGGDGERIWQPRNVQFHGEDAFVCQAVEAGAFPLIERVAVANVDGIVAGDDETARLPLAAAESNPKDAANRITNPVRYLAINRNFLAKGQNVLPSGAASPTRRTMLAGLFLIRLSQKKLSTPNYLKKKLNFMKVLRKLRTWRIMSPYRLTIIFAGCLIMTLNKGI